MMWRRLRGFAAVLPSRRLATTLFLKLSFSAWTIPDRAIVDLQATLGELGEPARAR
jgi:hypothetical protein